MYLPIIQPTINYIWPHPAYIFGGCQLLIESAYNYISREEG